MNFFGVLNMVLGLALFLYGMHVMGESLSKVAGGRLEKILEHLTNSPAKGVALGAAVTALIQSSSATTVMVVGFVNSRIMRLSQAVYIIMGANIGTTVTSWLLSLSGISGEGFFIRMLKPENFSPILAAIGIIMILFVKNSKKRDVGSIFIGFAILMVGMHTMSNAVEPLAKVPEFTSILTTFSNPVLGILAGAVFTAIIQSSSAAVGILQALCLSNAITFGTALPIIMGQNIGTCVTTLISSIGASKNAKRAAMVHLYFNLIGTILFVGVFYAINSMVNFAFLSENATVFGVAIIHTGFNLVATAVMMPFGKYIEKLAVLTIKEKAGDIEDTPIIDMRILETPAVAVEQSMISCRKMARRAKEATDIAIELLDDFSQEKADRVKQLETRADQYEDELGTFLVKLSRKNISKHNSHSVSIMLYCLSDFERISDYAIHIMRDAASLEESGEKFSYTAEYELKVYIEAIQELFQKTYDVFCTEDRNVAEQVESLMTVIHKLDKEIKVRHFQRLTDGTCSIELGFIFSDIMTSLKRIAGHCSNVAACVIEVRDDVYDTHEYAERIKSENSEVFRKSVELNRRKYSLD